MNNFDNIVKKALGKKSASPSFNTAKFFSKSWKQRGTKKDWDFDGIANKKDCQPFNTMRQDFLLKVAPNETINKVKNIHIKEQKEFMDDFDMGGFRSLSNVFEGFSNKNFSVFNVKTDTGNFMSADELYDLVQGRNVVSINGNSDENNVRPRPDLAIDDAKRKGYEGAIFDHEKEDSEGNEYIYNTWEKHFYPERTIGNAPTNLVGLKIDGLGFSVININQNIIRVVPFSSLDYSGYESNFTKVKQKDGEFAGITFYNKSNIQKNKRLPENIIVENKKYFIEYYDDRGKRIYTHNDFYNVVNNRVHIRNNR